MTSCDYSRLRDRAIDHSNRANIACICGSVQQRNDRDDIRRLEQMPARQRLLRAGANRDREDVISGQFGLAQRSEHVC